MASRSKTKKEEKEQKPSSILTKNNTFVENYGSTVLGFVVVLILGSFLFNVFRGNTPKQNGEIESGEETQKESIAEEKTHTVVAGEDLWKISEKYFNTGYNWINIAKANNITNPDQIEVGQQLVIPTEAPVSEPTQTSTEPTTVVATPDLSPTEVKPTQDQEEKPVGSTSLYTVQKDDSLWSIAVKEYNNGYRWIDIARANKLGNPNIIHVGNQLSIPK